MVTKKVKLDEVELEIEKDGCLIYVSQLVNVTEADDSEHLEKWLIEEAEVSTPEIPESKAS